RGIEGARHRLGMRCRDQLDATLLELGAESGDLLLLELMLVDVGLEDLLLELSERLSLVEKGAGVQFSQLGQFRSLPLVLLQRTGAGWRHTFFNALGRPGIPTTEGLGATFDG